MTIQTGIPLSDFGIFKVLCEATGKWGLMISFEPWPEGAEDNWFNENIQASGGYLEFDRDVQVLHDGFGVFLFDFEHEMREAFEHMVNHKYGPTEKNDYRGPASINAFTCSNTGQGLNENI